jgi:hypothetical protein
MENDPHQLKNLAGDANYKDVQAELAKLIGEYKDQHGLPK